MHPAPTRTLAKVADENARAGKRASWGRGTYVCPNEPKLEQLLRPGSRARAPRPEAAAPGGVAGTGAHGGAP
ncbi:MAG: hypothetical protein BRD34_00220 [Bacteroidetes bacterium QH_6_64_77]|nr:MAG: hypothetical protein BRD34_00220 [Bacteroidetes bacterium QH_6_64_77]